MHSACDIEGHVGTDGRNYLLDFARSFPPEDPTEVPRHSQQKCPKDGVYVALNRCAAATRGFLFLFFVLLSQKKINEEKTLKEEGNGETNEEE